MARTDERRRTQRVKIAGDAVIHTAGGAIRCSIVDLSLGGALLRTEGAVDVTADTWVKIDLHFGAGAGAWASLHGWLRRHQVGGDVALVFGAVPAATEDAIEDEVLAALESLRKPRVLVIDSSAARRQRTVATLHDIGCSTFEASTPLDAISLIDASHSRVILAAIAEDQRDGKDIRAFLHAHHPEIHIVVIADRTRPGTLREGELGRHVRRWLLPVVTLPEWRAA